MTADISPGWRASSRSSGNGECVEVAEIPSAIGVRDSKNPRLPYLRVAAPAFRRLISQVKAGRHDLA
ncbi:uncharacterized protein DUF397 [Actinocorallia herbida]|uniref:Uncharacterized protein DUF397 n=1 Tax=Actinocorallia herbida TaxID=58109 RepID=A0A3N1D5J9_9ACTN|nr:DUF397 domain-containing protein [Actinocorallia herbida]ROO88749.1 uncharacterized protein DUF397 [Actinocorallia herbida]